jgi:two-component system response regulator FixJ
MRIIYIVDNVSRDRAATSFLLRNCGFETRVYDSGAEFLNTNPTDGCVVLKVHLPGMNGLEVHDRMIARGINLPVIFLDGDVPLAVRAMQQGAVDFIMLPYEPDELVHAIEHAFVLADDGQEIRNIRSIATTKLSALTPRGLQVLQGLQAGMANTMIAHWLKLSPRSVEAYRATMMTKIGASNLSQAIRIAHDGGLAPIDASGAALALTI